MNEAKKILLKALAAVKQYALIALLAIGLGVAIGLVHNAIAQRDTGSQANEGQGYQGSANPKRYLYLDRYMGSQNQQASKGNQNQQDDDSQIHSVPDTGSTAVLLGLSFVLVAMAQRRRTIVSNNAGCKVCRFAGLRNIPR